MATYPLGIKRFTTKRDLLDDVDAAHINDMQSEITAIEDMLGPNPHQDSLDAAWRWKTLKSRLEYMIRGYQTPCWALFNGTLKTFSSDIRSQMTFPAPSKQDDTHGLFSSSTIKVKRPGYYTFTGRVFFAASSLRGNRVLMLAGSTGLKALSSQMMLNAVSQPDGMWLIVQWEGFMDKGETMGLYTNLVTGGYDNGRYSVDNAALTGHMVRDA